MLPLHVSNCFSLRTYCSLGTGFIFRSYDFFRSRLVVIAHADKGINIKPLSIFFAQQIESGVEIVFGFECYLVDIVLRLLSTSNIVQRCFPLLGALTLLLDVKRSGYKCSCYPAILSFRVVTKAYVFFQCVVECCLLARSDMG